ncbi:hypothetical protein ISF12_11695 [Pseudomonas aeruginosa]|nr:hypothetical protein [Pseudomonas aeruginosa]
MNITQLRETTQSAYRELFYGLAGAAPPDDSQDNLLVPCVSLGRAQGVMDLTGMNLVSNVEIYGDTGSAMRVTGAILIHLLALTEAYMQNREKALGWLSKPMAQLNGESIFTTALKGGPEDLDVAEQFVLRMGEGFAL